MYRKNQINKTYYKKKVISIKNPTKKKPEKKNIQTNANNIYINVQK